MQEDVDEDLELEQHRAKQREENSRYELETDIFSLIMDLRGGANFERPPLLGRSAHPNAGAHATHLIREVVTKHRQRGEDSGLIQGGRRALDWVQAQLAAGTLPEHLSDLDVAQIVLEPRTNEIDLVFQLRRAARELLQFAEEGNLRSLPSRHRRVGELMGELRELRRIRGPKKGRGKTPKAIEEVVETSETRPSGGA